MVELADQEDGRLVPQNNHLIGVWMPGSFIEQRKSNNEELKSKGRIRASGSYQEGTGKSGSYGMWNPPRGHDWNVFVRPASS